MSANERAPLRWRVRGAQASVADLLAEWRLAAEARQTVAGARGDTWTKGAPLSGKAAWRHAARGWAGLALPRFRELANLEWLRAHGFRAPNPLVAAAAFRGALPRWQGLATERVAAARAWTDALAHAAPAVRAALVADLAAALARLHAAGFVHRDLYLRNLLALGSEPVFLDCWRGGPGSARARIAERLGRGSAYDLACFFVHAPGVLERAEEEAFGERYAEERAHLGAPVTARFAASLARSRAREARREDGRGRCDAGAIRAEWRPPDALSVRR